MGTRNQLVPHTPLVVKIGRDSAALEVLPEKWGVPVPHQAPPAHGPRAGKRSPRNFWLWKSAGIVTGWDGGLLVSPVFLLKSLCLCKTYTGPRSGRQLEKHLGPAGGTDFVFAKFASGPRRTVMDFWRMGLSVVRHEHPENSWYI